VSVSRGSPDQREQERHMTAMFDKVAPRYDLLNRVLSLGTDIGWRRRAIAWARLAAGEVALDVGVGTGDLTFALLASSTTSARVVGIDLSPAMLERSRLRAARLGHGRRYAAVRASAHRIPLRNGSLDLIVSAFTLRNLADLDGSFREMRRVLRAGGRLVLLELSHPPSERLARIFGLYFDHFAPRIAERLGGDREAYRYLPRSVKPFPRAEGLAQRLTAAGFSGVSFERLTFGIAAIHVGSA
jgi:demethylmenaquinone methyltransferase / 2-methoxy-6-polyprenyl-1,4-benzoquinol methylase